MTIVSCETFVPHTKEHLQAVGAYIPPLPDKAYDKLVEEYDALHDVKVFRIVYESDGLNVTGLLAMPEEAGNGAHPVLIYNRGGNREYGMLTVLSAMRSMVPFAKKGYVVFASNYRGNDGGEGKEEFGGADVNDVLNLLAAARSHKAFDGRNSYMIGHSRGGMMTAMALRQGADVNAAILIAGLSDVWQSAKERPGIDENVYRKLICGEDREAEYLRRSPAQWAEEIATPLLLLHGDADDKVDISHSIRLAERLHKAGRPHQLHIYPGGSHALLRDWGDVLLRCNQWMEQWRV